MIYILCCLPDYLCCSEVSIVLLEVSNTKTHRPLPLQEKLSG